jgi:hypothetical protein
MHFGENQLSRSLIGLSPLPTTHPLSFQPKWVRASTTSYRRFTLAMGRSLRFGSRACHSRSPYSDSLSLRLPPNGLTSRHTTNSQAHSSKGTPSARKPLTDCKHTVSGTISLPSRGTFHHSLTVLIRYRSPRSIQAYRVVPADSQQISRARCYLGTQIAPPQGFQVRDSHPLRPTLPSRSPNPRSISARSGRTKDIVPHNTTHATPAGYHTHAV